jgi:hypothetical protein
VPPLAGCPNVLDFLSRHLEDDVSPELCHEMGAHAAECPSCSARCDSLSRELSRSRACPAPEVPDEIKQLAARPMRAALDASGEH